MIEKNIWYLTKDDVKGIYNKTMQISDNTYNGIINSGALQSVLEHIQNDSYYPEFSDKLSHLFVSITKFHCFQDGNKRSALALSTAFLVFNGYSGIVSEFSKEMEQFVVLVASGAMSEELCKKIIGEILSGDYGTNIPMKIEILESLARQEEIIRAFT